MCERLSASLTLESSAKSIAKSNTLSSAFAQWFPNANLADAAIWRLVGTLHF